MKKRIKMIDLRNLKKKKDIEKKKNEPVLRSSDDSHKKCLPSLKEYLAPPQK